MCVGASVYVIDGLMIDDSPAPSVLGSCASSKLNGLGSLPGVDGFSDDEPGISESSRDKLAGSGFSEKSAAIETEKPAIKNARRCMIERRE